MSQEKVRVYMESVVDGLIEAEDEVRQALALIAMEYSIHADPLAVQLLAVRRYLRVERRLAARWSWTNEEAKARSREGPTKTLYLEADKVIQKFNSQNAGYTLVVSPIRSLERQARLWSTNTTVHLAGKQLVTQMQKELEAPLYPVQPTGLAVAWFRNTLRHAVVRPEPTNAAPGTSDHGRGTAVDFVVRQGLRTIADTKTAQIETIWKPAGWGTRLIAACEGTQLKGPLKHPYEPWHWTLKA
jgi:hypothetical protein